MVISLGSSVSGLDAHVVVAKYTHHAIFRPQAAQDIHIGGFGSADGYQVAPETDKVGLQGIDTIHYVLQRCGTIIKSGEV